MDQGSVDVTKEQGEQGEHELLNDPVAATTENVDVTEEKVEHKLPNDPVAADGTPSSASDSTDGKKEPATQNMEDIIDFIKNMEIVKKPPYSTIMKSIGVLNSTIDEF